MSEQIASKLPDLGTRTDEITIFAGPCSIESEEQFNEVAECVAGLGLHWIRGGAFKPRTNPHSFQGLGEEALRIEFTQVSRRIMSVQFSGNEPLEVRATFPTQLRRVSIPVRLLRGQIGLCREQGSRYPFKDQ